MKRYLGLSYSNIQNKYEIPCYIGGIQINETNLQQLTSMAESEKGNILRVTDNIAELKARYYEILPYLDNYVVISLKINQPSEWIDSISAMYVEAVQYLMNNEQTLQKDETVINYNRILSLPGFIYQDINEETRRIFQKVGSYSFDNSFTERIASFFAKVDFTVIRETKSEIISKKIAANPNNCVHFHKLSYHREYPDNYDDYFVGLPELLLKEPKRSHHRQALNNNTKFNLKPIAKFCRGIRDGGSLKPCIFTSSERLFGNIVFQRTEERCPACKELSKTAECLKDKPLCNGLDPMCRDIKFAGEICNGEFGVYITRYCNYLKVGKALLANTISRLLDQGANSALVIYPISNIKDCYEIEHGLQSYLQYRLAEIGQGIEEVTLQSPRTNVKIQDFLNNWERNDSALLDSVLKLVNFGAIGVGDRTIKLSTFQRKKCMFLSNYRKPEYQTITGIIQPPDKIDGKMVGYRGSVLFFDNSKAVDLKRYQGYVLRGSILNAK